MKKIFIPIFMILSAVAHASGIQDTVRTDEGSRVMTLHDCMEYALKYSTKYEILKLDNADIRLERRDAILKTFTPSVSAGTYASTSFGRAVDPEYDFVQQRLLDKRQPDIVQRFCIAEQHQDLADSRKDGNVRRRETGKRTLSGCDGSLL